MLSRAVKQEPGAGGGRSSGPPGAVAPQVKRRRVCKGAPTAPSSSSTQVVWGFKGQGFVKHLLQGRGSQRAGWGPRVAEESRSRISGRSLDTMGQGVLGLPKASCFGPPPTRCSLFVCCVLCILLGPQYPPYHPNPTHTGYGGDRSTAHHRPPQRRPHRAAGALQLRVVLCRRLRFGDDGVSFQGCPFQSSEAQLCDIAEEQPQRPWLHSDCKHPDPR